MHSRRFSAVYLLIAILFLCAFGSPSFGAQNAATPVQSSSSSASTPVQMATIPGPLRSFLRMAAISQKVSPGEVLPLLARNVNVIGYQNGRPTQFLILVNWYMDQARELEAMAGPQGVIHVPDCDHVKPLLLILGYRMRQPCGPDAALETADANRAFLTIDSGFPLADLEDALRSGKPFDAPYVSAKVPVISDPNRWILNEKNANRGVVESLLRDPQLSRLYWALSRMDTETANFLWNSLGEKKLLAAAPVLDFYGGHISVRAGRVIVPGGVSSESAWKNIVGASPTSPAEFVSLLTSKDEGWAAAYFDALSRVGLAQQAYFASPSRLQRFYDALRGPTNTSSATKHAFRPDQGLFLLVARLQLDANGQPHIPGGVEVWKEVMHRKTDSKIMKEWAKRSNSWNNPEQFMEGMFGVSRLDSSDAPVKNLLMLNEIDRGRGSDQQLSSQTFRLLADKFPRLGDQYLIFSEFHSLNDASITQFLNVAEGLNQISDVLLRADAMGMLQANVGLWEILARQGEIPIVRLNDSWQKVVSPFATLHSSAQVYEAGRTALSEMLRASTEKPTLSQDQFIALLAGPEQSDREARQIRAEMAGRMRQVMDDQRLVSLDTLIALGDGLTQMSKGKDASASLLSLSGELREFEMPKPLFTNRERSELANGLYSNRHTVLQMRTDLTKIVKGAASPAELAEARGLLTPFLRDTLVGLNYAYYEPPGAQMIHSNPLFVRSHDFSGGDYSGEAATANQQAWRSPRLFGRGWTASGGAHLIGSLADLPYVLAKVEEDFIVPQNVQSLIWEDMAPGLVTSAILPRWWGVTRNELHAVALYQRAGEELLAAAAQDDKLRQSVLTILSDRMLPQRLEQVDMTLRARQQPGRSEDSLDLIAPAETFYLAVEYRRRNPQQKETWGPSGKELAELVMQASSETSYERLSMDFGVPHPALTQNYSRELMNLKPLPTFMDYSSRLLAEYWDSNNLYWARLADEMGYSPAMLHRIIPQLTRRMVEQTFASNLEDWPAMLRAMRETGEEFRQGKIASLAKTSSASGPQ